ncbi:hypothetical protein J5N97_029536 [Dioscorea zingiberensis]|uniref:4-coumarate--CoA ligase n=1 Tax=Dioscorea zingiberensis TaxID=325984 RepID=A0A9D5H5R2_9LILI|nr:hypothetical protein J5N97_029536 [Dioscorea zingiberensis]
MATEPCCISREFHRVASEKPGHIAAVRATGGLRVCKDALERFREEPERFDFEGRRGASSFPPVYPGDECFSFADVLSAVFSLSRRIRAVLDGGDDPNLVRPQGSRTAGYSHGEQTLSSSGSLSELNGSPLTSRMPIIIGVFIAPSIEYIVSVLSILKCGEAFLPLDPSWPEERLLSVISSSGTVIILKCHPSCSTEVDWIVNRSGCSVLYVYVEASLKKNAACDLVCPCESKIPRRFCYVMYTSGSTGKPKGVCGTERGLLNRFWWMQQRAPLFGDDVLLFKTPISFIDHLQEFLSSVLTCTTLIIPPFHELKANPLLIINFLEGSKVLSEIDISHVDGRHGNKELVSSIKSWMTKKVPPTMVPSYYFFIESLPRTATGKVDYALLPSLTSTARWEHGDERSYNNQLHMIKEAFSDALVIKEVKAQDDFFYDGWKNLIQTSVSRNAGSAKEQKLHENMWNRCGSHDHFLYALNYNEHSCVYKISCGGSIYGSPSIDMVHNIIYVASTSGRVTAISLADAQFQVAWRYECRAPIFGSLCLDTHGNVICCLVDGHVNALDSSGNVIWKALVGGPIFAGACLSLALPSQVLICCRNGILYSFDMEVGTLLWEYQAGHPITASAYIDEQTCLISEQSSLCERLVCICSSVGSVHVLKVSPDIKERRHNQAGDSETPLVQVLAVMNLPGDIFSSPVMIGGRIFVGCRDDYVHCLNVVF